MSIGLGTALYASLICTLIGWLGYGMFHFGLNTPVVAGVIVGALLGDIQTGIIIGGTLTLVYLGVQGVGAAIPVNQTTATTVATALCILAKVEMETAITLAVPVAVLGQLDRMASWVINAAWMHVADKYAAEDNLSGIERLNYVGSAVFFISEFIPVFLCIYFGSQFVTAINEGMPVWVTAWLKMATGMLPALGFGMLFTMMYKPKFLPYFIIGFVLAAYFGANLQAVALFGLAAALLNFYKEEKKGAK
jgi:mannose/fructose/N-acetylgalactosamine-specific phosphotransferase system component IIC